MIILTSRWSNETTKRSITGGSVYETWNCISKKDENSDEARILAGGSCLFNIIFIIEVIIKLIGMGWKGMCQSYRNCYDLGNGIKFTPTTFYRVLPPDNYCVYRDFYRASLWLKSRNLLLNHAKVITSASVPWLFLFFLSLQSKGIIWSLKENVDSVTWSTKSRDF